MPTTAPDAAPSIEPSAALAALLERHGLELPRPGRAEAIADLNGCPHLLFVPKDRLERGWVDGRARMDYGMHTALARGTHDRAGHLYGFGRGKDRDAFAAFYGVAP